MELKLTITIPDGKWLEKFRYLAWERNITPKELLMQAVQEVVSSSEERRGEITEDNLREA